MDETLHDKITRITNELDALEQKGITTEEEINLQNQLINERSEAVHELAQQEKIEEKVEAEAIPFAVAGVSLDGIPVEVVQFGEALVKTDRRRIHKDHAVEIAQLEQRHAEELTRGDEQYALLQHDFATYKQASAEKIERLKGAHEELSAAHTAFVEGHDSVVAELRLTIEDISNKRDAAVNAREEAESELREVRKENERLESEVKDYRLAKVYGEESQGIIDVTPDEQTDIAAALENVKKLYKSVEDWGSVLKVNKPDGTYELAKRAEVEADWAPIELPDRMGGSEPAATFLGQDQTPADNGDTQAAEEAPEVVEDAPFQGQVPDAHAADKLDEGHAPLEMAGEPITLEDRITALEIEVFGEVRGRVA